MTVFGKIWGKTTPIFQHPLVEFHRIQLYKGYKCSKHIHKHKWNGFYVINGTLLINVKKIDYDLIDTTILTPEEPWTMVKPGELHWFESATDVDAFELYWPETLSEDIVREDHGGVLQ